MPKPIVVDEVPAVDTEYFPRLPWVAYDQEYEFVRHPWGRNKHAPTIANAFMDVACKQEYWHATPAASVIQQIITAGRLPMFGLSRYTINRWINKLCNQGYFVLYEWRLDGKKYLIPTLKLADLVSENELVRSSRPVSRPILEKRQPRRTA